MHAKASILAALSLLAAFPVRGAYTFTFYPGNAVVPDDDPNGYQNTVDLSGVAGTISDVTVTLNIAGGFNGDLYAWLGHAGELSILLNRVGVYAGNSVGYGDAGFGPDAGQVSFTLDDQAQGDVHFYQSSSYQLNGNRQLTGSWQPDGRLLDPSSNPDSFAATPRSNLLSVFNGSDANGDWTLYIADLSPGGVSTLVSWGLQIEVVPEPGSLALLLCGATLLWRIARSNGHRGRRQPSGSTASRPAPRAGDGLR